MTRKAFITAISALLIGLFIYITIVKMINYNLFRHVLSVSPLIGSKMAATAVSIVVLICMIWIAVLLFIPSTRLWGLYGSVAFLLVITFYLGYVIYFTSRWDYPFSGVLRPRFGIFSMTWKQFFVFIIFFLVISFVGMLLEMKRSVKEGEREIPPVVFT